MVSWEEGLRPGRRRWVAFGRVFLGAVLSVVSVLAEPE